MAEYPEQPPYPPQLQEKVAVSKIALREIAQDAESSEFERLRALKEMREAINQLMFLLASPRDKVS